MTDVLAFAALLLVLRFIQHLRLLPGMGPMLLAIVKTWHDVTVILYLGAMIGFVLACSFAFQIAFGAENPNFSSMSRSFMALFQIVRAQLVGGHLSWQCCVRVRSCGIRL